MITSPIILLNKTILVVGGAGFIGSNLVKRLITYKPKKIYIVDNLISADVSNIPDHPCVEFRFGSISDDLVLYELPNDIEFVFHLGCYHGNQSSIINPIADHENNTLTSLKLFNKLSKSSSLVKLIYAGAACAVAEKTYDQPTPTTEDQPISLYHDSPYSISKIIGELYGNYFFSHFGLPIVKARFSNVFGPGEILGAGQWRGSIHTIWRNVIPTFIWRSLNGEELPLDNGGETSRDFIFVDDMVDGLIACLLKGRVGEVYNLATGRETKIIQLAQLINKLTDNSASLKLLPARAWDKSGKRFASTDKAQKELGFNAKTSMEDAINISIDWTKENYDLINKNIEKHKVFLKEKDY